jgi:hypothetical protein
MRTITRLWYLNWHTKVNALQETNSDLIKFGRDATNLKTYKVWSSSLCSRLSVFIQSKYSSGSVIQNLHWLVDSVQGILLLWNPQILCHHNSPPLDSILNKFTSSKPISVRSVLILIIWSPNLLLSMLSSKRNFVHCFRRPFSLSVPPQH